MFLVQTVAPAAEPLTLDEAKAHLNVDSDHEDALITSLIVAARRHAEAKTNRVLITQTWRQDLDAFAACQIELARVKVASVTSVTYLDPDGARQTLDAGLYGLYGDDSTAWIQPAYGLTWPSCRVWPGSVQITFVAGYGNAAAVPQEIKQWMLLQVGALYAQREGLAAGGPVTEVPRAAWEALLDAYRVWKF